MPLSKVIIVGAGPSGLLLALLLARAGILVELLEQTASLDTNPRASHYTAESCMEFDRAGILDEVRAQGFTPDGVSWRRLDDDKTRLVMLRNAINDDPESTEGRYRMVCLPLHKLGRILEREVGEHGAEIKYGYKVVEIGEDQEKGKAWVRVEKEGPEGGGKKEEEVREADYVVGCDGANSTIRRKLFGEMVFPGFTWDKQIVATNMYYDFEPYDYDDSQFFVHPEHW
jgi:2-polyprenyl-6-methoxyphenol hydroxylase-like FAD-dependent oxidoreductase